MSRVTLDTPLRAVVGRTAAVLETAFDHRTVGDLLRHYPRRYYERGELARLSELRPGELVTIQVQVVKVYGRQIRDKLHKLDITVTDGHGQLVVTFFNRKFLGKRLLPGDTVLFAGEVERFHRRLQLKQPEMQEVGDDDDDFAGGLRPIYPATKALRTWNIAKAVRTVLDIVDIDEDPLPELVRKRWDLPALSDALRLIHRPETLADVARARERLKWDEAFALQVVLAQRRAAAAAEPAIPRRPRPDGLSAAFDGRLPFALTEGQRRVGDELLADLAREHPMHRLLQGEVGSGKTVCAVRAMLAVVDSGGQAALLAPTEVLAQQHARSISTLLGPLADAGRLGGAEQATRVALLTGSQSAGQRRTNLLDAASGQAGIVVGTHALLEEHVQFADLGLVVVDEQHRFGVEQRDALRGKGARPPHLLVMTATPIPRTVAMTVFGDLDVSTLAELPAGRMPIQTTVVPVGEKPQWLDRAWDRVEEEIAGGGQVYVVCPRIGEGTGVGSSDDFPEVPEYADGGEARAAAAAVVEWLPRLRERLPDRRVEMLHGRMPGEAKDDVMQQFAAGAVDVLVATTVIEVGVDVPNATVMVVLDADRFGISQLHQLRGRVGRGEAPGLCLLVTETAADTPARERLDGVAATLDGFELARLDLEQRREGDVLGEEQSGRKSSLRLLRLLRDERIIEAARTEAAALVAEDPHLSGHPALAAAIERLVDDTRAEYLEKA